MENELIKSIKNIFSLDVADSDQLNLKSLLSTKINDWIVNDFNKLIHALYRLDVSESRINQLLEQKKAEDAADILADLVIERELQRIEARKLYRRSEDISDEEKW